MSTTKVPLNVFINKEKSKVLFAEANNYVADILLSFLALPLGKIMKIFNRHYKYNRSIGSFTTLYKGLADLDSCHFSVDSVKELLLDPKSSFEADFRKLMLDFTDTQKYTQYFRCKNWNCGYFNLSMYSDVAECDCGKPLNNKFSVLDTLSPDVDGGVFTINPSSFLITDDLRVVPIVNGIIQTINSLGINTEGVKLRSLSLDAGDIIDLLEFSLTSTTPLTDLILKGFKKSPTAAIRIEKETVSDTFKKMTLKASLQKSINKFLFAQVTYDFVECLFSLLDVHLGSLEYIFSGNTFLQNINNLYRSVTDVIDDKYFTTPDTKNRLISLKLPHGYVFKNKFLPLHEEDPPKLYYDDTEIYPVNRLNEKGCGKLVAHFRSNKINYVKNGIYIVTDDLVVSPCMAMTFCILNGLGIPLSDFKEMELHVGIEELLAILKVYFTSTTAISDALINPILKTEPKQEPYPIVKIEPKQEC